MKAELSLYSVWSYEPLINHFFRAQSINTLDKLLDSSEESYDEVLGLIEEYCKLAEYDFDDLDEMLYNESIDYLAKEFNLTLMNDYEEEE